MSQRVLSLLIGPFISKSFYPVFSSATRPSDSLTQPSLHPSPTMQQQVLNNYKPNQLPTPQKYHSTLNIKKTADIAIFQFLLFITIFDDDLYYHSYIKIDILSMDANPVPQSYLDFFSRFIRAEQIPKGKRGVIFIGNTRAGKSTLACAAAGSQMKLIYDGQQSQTFYQPMGQIYEGKVRHILASVTEQPNFFKERKLNNNYAIIDMPGYADSSRFRQLINFHYIQTMTNNLEELRFLIVLNMKPGENETFHLDSFDLKMMENFSEMFPDCKDAVGLVINRLKHKPDKYLEKNILLSLNSILINSDELKNCGINNPTAFRQYFEPSSRKIHIILRPEYTLGPKQQTKWEKPNRELRNKMMEICNNSKENFMLSKDLKVKLKIFRDGEKEGNKKFLDLLKNIYDSLEKGMKEGYNVFYNLILLSLQNVVDSTKIQTKIHENCSQFLKKFIAEPGPEEEINQGNEILQQTRIISFFNIISEMNLVLQKQDIQKKGELLEQQLKQILTKLNKILKQSCEVEKRSKISKQLQLFKITMQRFVQQYTFIRKTFVVHDKKGTNQIQKISEDIKGLFDSLAAYNTFDNHIEYYRTPLSKIFDNYVQLQIKKVLMNKPNLFEQIINQVIQGLDQSTNIYLAGKNVNQIPADDKENIQKKKKDLQLYLLINYPSPRPEKNKEILVKLLQKYNQHDKGNKLIIAFRIATLLEQQKQYKKALGLFLHTQRNQDVIRLLELIAQSKKENSVQLYSLVADQYLEKGRWTYFERCIEKAKKYAFELEQFITLEKKLAKGAQKLQKIPIFNIEPLKKSTLDENLEYWKWQRIDEEINFLKSKFSNGKISKTKTIVALEYR